MKYTKDYLLKLRDNTDRLLKSYEEKEKDKYEKLAMSFTASQKDIDDILSKIKNDSSYDKLSTQLLQLSNEISTAIAGMKPDMKPVVDAINSLSTKIKTEKFDTTGIIGAIQNLERLTASKKPTKEVNDRTDEIIKAIRGLKLETPEVEFPETIAISNFPPQKVAQPATNINLNPLRGFIHTTAQTISTTLSALPSYGVLENRRSIMVYNNSSTVTIFIGGSDVTATNGLPVPPKSYSPPIDAGVKMILYAVTSSSTANVRVLEISNDRIGG